MSEVTVSGHQPVHDRSNGQLSVYKLGGPLSFFSQLLATIPYTMDGRREQRPAASYREDPSIPNYIQSKLDEALETLRRHSQQKRWEEEYRPRHSHSPYGRRHHSWRPKDRLRGEEAGHSGPEAPLRDHYYSEEYDPQGKDTETNNYEFACPQGLKISPSLLTALFDNLSISKCL
jgi:hypothetical protein